MTDNSSVRRFTDTLPGVGSRRLSNRHKFQATVEVLPMDGRRSISRGVTSDISHKGVFVIASEMPALETMVVLKICTDFGTLKVATRVVHNLNRIGFGCEFIDITERQQHEIDYLVTLTSAPRSTTIH